jgi:AAA domain
MVATVGNAWPGAPRPDGLPLVVEVVGPAGAGKSTVSGMLVRGGEQIVLSDPPFVWSLADFPFFFRYGLPLVPTLLRLYFGQDGRRPTRREVADMLILNGWHRVVRARIARGVRVVVLDQGPVFYLTTLQEFGSESLRSHNTDGWWKTMYTQWAAALDMVVYLDASDACLADRIRSRKTWHMVKDKPTPEISDFLASYRAAYEKVLSRLTGSNGMLKVLAFNTAQHTPEQLVGELLAEFGMGRAGRYVG